MFLHFIKAEYHLEPIINCICHDVGGVVVVVVQKCIKIDFLLPGYPTHVGCHDNKENEIL